MVIHYNQGFYGGTAQQAVICTAPISNFNIHEPPRALWPCVVRRLHLTLVRPGWWGGDMFVNFWDRCFTCRICVDKFSIYVKSDYLDVILDITQTSCFSII